MKLWAKILGLLAGSICAMPGAGSAHDGPHVARVITDVVSVARDGQVVLLDLQIQTLEEPLTLVAVSAGFAETTPQVPETRILPGRPLRQAVRLHFLDDAPKLFTLMLDFGHAGLSTVLVVAR
jgi:hypothetical protein